jgi:hypothetical protein
MLRKELEQTGAPEPKMEDWFLVATKDAKKKILIIIEGLEEISKIRANEYLGCNLIFEEKKRNYINFVKFIGEIKDVLESYKFD